MTVSFVAAAYASATESVTSGFEPAADREYVEVNLDRSLIEQAMGIVGAKEPSLAALLTEIERVNIRVIGLGESNRASSLKHIEEIRSNLGPAALIPARFFIRFIKDIPPEARLALSAARRASVGIYSIDTGDHAIDSRELLTNSGE